MVPLPWGGLERGSGGKSVLPGTGEHKISTRGGPFQEPYPSEHLGGLQLAPACEPANTGLFLPEANEHRVRTPRQGAECDVTCLQDSQVGAGSGPSQAMCLRRAEGNVPVRPRPRRGRRELSWRVRRASKQPLITPAIRVAGKLTPRGRGALRAAFS